MLICVLEAVLVCRFVLETVLVPSRAPPPPPPPCFFALEQELMEALLLLESCLDPKWVKSWYAPSQEKMASTSYLLRLATPAAVALHLFSLDRAILYDKVGVAAKDLTQCAGHVLSLLLFTFAVCLCLFWLYDSCCVSVCLSSCLHVHCCRTIKIKGWCCLLHASVVDGCTLCDRHGAWCIMQAIKARWRVEP